MSSSQYTTCSALHRRSQGVQLWNPEQTPLTHRVASWIPSTPKKKLTIHVRRLCCSPGCPTESATGSRCELAAVQPGPWPAGYFLLLLQNKTDAPEGQGHRTAKTNKPTNEFKDKPTSCSLSDLRVAIQLFSGAKETGLLALEQWRTVEAHYISL